MLTIRIIPCLDIKDGRIVKGVRFVDLVDAGDPVEAACAYEAAGADELCFLDITASSDNRAIIFDMIRSVAEQCFMPFTVGGGVRCVEDARKLLLSGADKVSFNTTAVHHPDVISESAKKFGTQCVVVAIDAKLVDQEGDKKRWEIFTHGGREKTGIEVIDFVRDMTARGVGEILLTSMDCDGRGEGFDLELTRKVSEATSVPVIASGGVGHPSHFVEGVEKGKASAVLAASIFHFGKFTIGEAKKIMADSGINVRL